MRFSSTILCDISKCAHDKNNWMETWIFITFPAKLWILIYVQISFRLCVINSTQKEWGRNGRKNELWEPQTRRRNDLNLGKFDFLFCFVLLWATLFYKKQCHENSLEIMSWEFFRNNILECNNHNCPLRVNSWHLYNLFLNQNHL